MVFSHLLSPSFSTPLDSVLLYSALLCSTLFYGIRLYYTTLCSAIPNYTIASCYYYYYDYDDYDYDYYYDYYCDDYYYCTILSLYYTMRHSWHQRT